MGRVATVDRIHNGGVPPEIRHHGKVIPMATCFRARLGVLALGLGLLGAQLQSVRADGTETLGTPSIAIQSGTGIFGGGVGLVEGPGIGLVEFEVPLDVTILQVLVYWNGFDEDPALGASRAVRLDSVVVFGDLIGGPTLFFVRNNSYTYRADITSLGLVVNGPNSIEARGLNFDHGDNGLSIVVIVDDGSASAGIEIKDGQDLAFVNFAPPLDTTVAQTFTFDAAATDRDAELVFIAGSVDGPASGSEPDRPSIIRVTVGGVVTDYADVLSSNNGPEWDHITLAVTIPAGASELTVQALSQDCCASGNTPASLAWVFSGLTVPVVEDEETPPGKICGKVFKDLDNDGRRDCREPMLPGVAVHLVCAGPDGQLGTSDDQTRSTTTNRWGRFCFYDVPALTPCEVLIDATPLCRTSCQSSCRCRTTCLVPGACPTVVSVTLQPGEQRCDLCFCLTKQRLPSQHHYGHKGKGHHKGGHSYRRYWR